MAFKVSDEDVTLMRVAGLAVPESVEDVKKLLQEAEADAEEIDLDVAFEEIRVRLRQKFDAASAATGSVAIPGRKP